jgi:lysophospholipase L1-like esterase
VRLTGVGVSGARVAGVLEEQLPLVENNDPDLILIGVGANDVTHLTSLSEVQSDMEEILKRALATGAHVVVSGCPDMRASAWYQPLRSLAGLRGRSVTDAIRRAARETGVPMVPLAERTAPYFAKDPDLYNSEDDFHPSAAGYARWAEAIYPYLRQALGPPN